MKKYDILPLCAVVAVAVAVAVDVAVVEGGGDD
jgi:hypothetical protein